MARPEEGARLPAIASATLCWRDWHTPGVTAHDGLVRPDHPAIATALGEVQSATSLRTLLRDPIRFAWRYALHWREPADEDQPLEIDPLTFGTLVHELLKRAVDYLEPTPGFGRASSVDIENALGFAAEAVRVTWPLERPVPPAMLWRHVLDEGVALAFRALTFDERFQQAGSRTWTEIAFGYANAPGETPTASLPWTPDAEVKLTGTPFRVRGKIDRLDLAGDGRVRVSDYKTGIEPKNAAQIVFAGGKELQRVLYALAAKQLLPESQSVNARLIYLAGKDAVAHRLATVDTAVTEIAGHVGVAATSLRLGHALPGPDAEEAWNDYRLALPASFDAYLHRKRLGIGKTFGDLERVWRCR